MDGLDKTLIQSGEVVVPTLALAADLAFFQDSLGFRLDAVLPADAPRVAVLSGHGLRLRLEQQDSAEPVTLRLAGAGLASREADLRAPGGARVVLVDAAAKPPMPPLQPAFRHCPGGAHATFQPGRAGMLYRDLIPNRQGGRFIASHIRIPAGGPVPDYVHFHRVHFQVIYCYRGWVRVVYEDQGPAFVLEPGDCVLQPPQIRHRVLESSPGLEVIELSCPAEHETRVDHELALPTARAEPGRVFGGQRFVHHRAATASWRRSRRHGFESCETGIAAATGGLAAVRVLRGRDAAQGPFAAHAGELQFWFVLQGGVTLQREGENDRTLERGDAVVIPPGLSHRLVADLEECELLEVTLPGA